jgi:2-deoxy-D-gluconate 3-dehydrogenase
VTLGVRDPGAADGLVDEIATIGVGCFAVGMDVTDLARSRTAIDAAVSRFGRLDVLVNNAGGGVAGPASEVTEDDFDSVWALNTKSTFFLSQHAAEHMKSQGGGAIVNVSSQAGLVALPGESSYCIAKAAVNHPPGAWLSSGGT